MLKRNHTLKVVMLKLLSQDFSWAGCRLLASPDLGACGPGCVGTRATRGWHVCTLEEVFWPFPRVQMSAAELAAGCFLVRCCHPDLIPSAEFVRSDKLVCCPGLVKTGGHL